MRVDVPVRQNAVYYSGGIITITEADAYIITYVEFPFDTQLTSLMKE